MCLCVCIRVFKASLVPLAVVQEDGDWQGYLKLESCGPSKPQMRLLPSAHASSPLAHYQRDDRLGQAQLLALILQNLAPTENKEGPPGPKKGRPGELQASQSHLCAQQDHGADPPGNYARAHGK